MLRLKLDWDTEELTYDQPVAERCAWICILCYVADGQSERFNLDDFCRRHRLPRKAVRRIMDRAISMGELAFSKRGRLRITDWPKWASGESSKRDHRTYPSDWRDTRLDILARDGYRCQYCGEFGNTVDHIVPISRGGSSAYSNLVAACRPCNSQKNNRTPEEAGMPLK